MILPCNQTGGPFVRQSPGKEEADRTGSHPGRHPIQLALAQAEPTGRRGGFQFAPEGDAVDQAREIRDSGAEPVLVALE